MIRLNKLEKLTENQVRYMQSVLNKFNIATDEIKEHPQIWTILPVTVENHGMLLQECGFQELNINCLLRYLQLMRKKVSLLKLYKKIPEDLDVQKSLYSYLQAPPENAPPLNIVQETETLNNVYLSVLRHFLVWKLELKDEKQIQHILTIYHRIKHKSFRNIHRTFNILENDLKFTIDRIRKHSYLIHSNPDNLTNMLNDVPLIAGIKLKDVVQKHPKILMTNTDTIKKTLQILKDNHISDEAISKCLDIFTLSAESVLKRLNEMKIIPEFEALTTHPRALKLIHYQHKAKSRLLYLQRLKIKNASLHVLCAPDNRFERFAREGADKTRGDDLVNMLQDRLYQPSDQIRIRLSLHPFWYHVPLVTSKETLDFLFSEGYCKEDIFECVHILLYSKDQVNSELQKLRSRPELIRKWLTAVQRLNLCLYYIELPHHFTGDGIWNHTDISVDSPAA